MRYFNFVSEDHDVLGVSFALLLRYVPSELDEIARKVLGIAYHPHVCGEGALACTGGPDIPARWLVLAQGRAGLSARSRVPLIAGIAPGAQDFTNDDDASLLSELEERIQGIATMQGEDHTAAHGVDNWYRRARTW